MTVARRARRLVRLAIPLSLAALGAAALAGPATALAGGAADGPASGPGAALSPLNAVDGYLWWDDHAASGKPPSYYAFDSVGGSMTVTNLATGQYLADFGGLSGIAGSGIAQVTSYGATSSCQVGSYASDGHGGLKVYVDCFSGSSPANAEFTLMVSHPTGTPNGTYDYAYVNKTHSSGGLVVRQYNSHGRDNSVKWLSTGKYQVTFGGPRTSGTAGIAKVSAFGNAPGDCELVKWFGSSAGEVVDVNCYSGSHAAQNRAFLITYAATNNLMGQNSGVDANAFAHGTAAVYQPLVQYANGRGARVTVVHYATGSYEVLAAGSKGNIAEWGGDVQVNSVGASDARCAVGSWVQQLTPAIYIDCTDKHGSPTDTPFTVEWLVP